jgi:hypothetical protein
MKNILITAFFIMTMPSLFSQQKIQYGFSLGTEWTYPSTREVSPLHKGFLPNYKGQLLKIVSNTSFLYYFEKKENAFPVNLFAAIHSANSTVNSVLNFDGVHQEQLSQFWITSAHFGYYKDRKIKNEHTMRNQFSVGLEYAYRHRSEGDFSPNYFSKNILGLGFEWSNVLYRGESRMPISWGSRTGFSIANLNGFKKLKEHEGYVYSNLFFRVLL